MLVNDLLSTINFQHFRNVPESVSEIHFIKIEINEKRKEHFFSELTDKYTGSSGGSMSARALDTLLSFR